MCCVKLIPLNHFINAFITTTTFVAISYFSGNFGYRGTAWYDELQLFFGKFFPPLHNYSSFRLIWSPKWDSNSYLRRFELRVSADWTIWGYARLSGLSAATYSEIIIERSMVLGSLGISPIRTYPTICALFRLCSAQAAWATTMSSFDICRFGVLRRDNISYVAQRVGSLLITPTVTAESFLPFSCNLSTV